MRIKNVLKNWRHKFELEEGREFIVSQSTGTGQNRFVQNNKHLPQFFFFAVEKKMIVS